MNSPQIPKALIKSINEHQPKDYNARCSSFHPYSRIRIMENKYKYRDFSTIGLCLFYPNEKLKQHLDNNNISYKKSWKRDKLIKAVISF